MCARNALSMFESSILYVIKLPLTVTVASPCAPVVVGVGSFAPFRNAMKRSGSGGIDVRPTSSLQLPTPTSTANVPAANTRRPRIANLLTVGGPHAQGGLGIPAPRGLFKQSFVIEMSGRRQAYRCRARAAPVPVEAPVAVYDLRASVAARERSAASISASETGAGTVQDPRCIVGTRIAATSPPGPRSTTAVAASSGPWLALITSVQVPSEGHVRFRACTPSRDVSANSSLRERRSPPTIPSAVPETIYPIAVP